MLKYIVLYTISIIIINYQISYLDPKKEEKHLYYVKLSRALHELPTSIVI